jgi:hypothetical protein
VAPDRAKAKHKVRVRGNGLIDPALNCSTHTLAARKNAVSLVLRKVDPGFSNPEGRVELLPIASLRF